MCRCPGAHLGTHWRNCEKNPHKPPPRVKIAKQRPAVRYCDCGQPLTYTGRCVPCDALDAIYYSSRRGA